MIALGFHYRKEREREEKRERQKRLAAALKKKQQQMAVATANHSAGLDAAESSATLSPGCTLDIPRRASLTCSDEEEMIESHQVEVHSAAEPKSADQPTVSSLRNGVMKLKIVDDSALLKKKDKLQLGRMKSSVSFGTDTQADVVVHSKEFRTTRAGAMWKSVGRKPHTSSFSLFDRRGCEVPPVKKTSE